MSEQAQRGETIRLTVTVPAAISWAVRGVVPTAPTRDDRSLRAVDKKSISLLSNRRQVVSWILRSPLWGPLIILGAIAALAGVGYGAWLLWPYAVTAWSWLSDTVSGWWVSNVPALLDELREAAITVRDWWDGFRDSTPLL